MTITVITMLVMNRSVSEILSDWPSRSEVLKDAQEENADLDLVAVHRWAKRESIPSRYWWALAVGAKARGLGVTTEMLARAHATGRNAA